MTKLILLLSLLTCLVCMQSMAQSNLKLKPSKIQKLPKVDIEMADGKEVPRSWLYRVNRSDLQVVSKAYHDNSYDPIYFSGKILLEDIKSITILTRQRRFKTNIIGAVLGGAAGYLIGRSLRAEEHRNEQIEILSQRTLRTTPGL